MENNVTRKRYWSLEWNTSNKYMKFYNDRKVWFDLLSQTTTLLYIDVYRRYTQSKNLERTQVKEQLKNSIYICGVNTHSLPGNGPSEILKQN